MLNGQIGGFCAPEYFVGIYCPLSELVRGIESVGDQSALLRIKGEWIDRGQPIACGQSDDEITICEVNNVRRDDQAAMGLARKCHNDGSISSLLWASRLINLIFNQGAATSADFRYPMLGGS